MFRRPLKRRGLPEHLRAGGGFCLGRTGVRRRGNNASFPTKQRPNTRTPHTGAASTSAGAQRDLLYRYPLSADSYFTDMKSIRNWTILPIFHYACAAPAPAMADRLHMVQVISHLLRAWHGHRQSAAPGSRDRHDGDLRALQQTPTSPTRGPLGTLGVSARRLRGLRDTCSRPGKPSNWAARREDTRPGPGGQGRWCWSVLLSGARRSCQATTLRLPRDGGDRAGELQPRLTALNHRSHDIREHETTTQHQTH